MKKRRPYDYLLLSLKGMAMGAADIVPGVSGGTIAFISGIYEELINSINGIRPSLLKTWKTEGFKAFWKAFNGNFLAAVFIGIAISVLSLAKLISWLLENQAVLLWSFFFGLVLASILYVAKEIKKWNLGTVVAGLIGAALAVYITSLPVAEQNIGLPYLFLCGALAICAMILPGISGSFILVLLGAYKVVLDAVHERDIKIIAVVGLGAIVGLLSFARLLKWMFARYRNLTLALLTGFIMGSLKKIWPWKRVLESMVIEDKLIVLKETNTSPFNYEGDPQLIPAIVLALAGFSLIFVLEKLAVSRQ